MSLPYNADIAPIPAAAPAVRYRALCVPAVISLVLGALSILTALHLSLALIPVAGILLGWWAQRRIRAAPDEWTGLGLARLGIGLAVALWVLGYGWLVFARTSEVPFGYHRLTYEMLQPDPSTSTEPIPESAKDMHEKKVFIKGFIQPRRQQQGIKEFILCPSNHECPFCTPNPSRTEMVRVVLQGDMETMYTTHQIGVGGKFLVEPADPSGIPYGVEADYLR